MKKIVFALLLLMGFSFSTSAQEKSIATAPAKESTTDYNYKNDAKEIGEFLDLDSPKVKELAAYLEYKNKELNKISASKAFEERKIVVNKVLANKLNLVLGDEKFNKLKSNSALYNKALIK